jgi:formylglycine-generating enzyme required for sulfatase activity
MGSPEGIGNLDEHPQHTVFLDAFWIDRTAVTNAMFQTFVRAANYITYAEKGGFGWVLNFSNRNWERVNGANWQYPSGPSSSLEGLEDHPVVQVSWNDAKAYCEWTESRLPSEAEWEKAARGPDGRTYPWGDQQPAGDLANFADINLKVSWADKTINDGYQFTAPVDSFPKGASLYGALNMAGNVWQWVADWYDENYYASSPSINPLGPSSGLYRVDRGGSWNFEAIPSARRGALNPDDRRYNIGFRCARPAD